MKTISLLLLCLSVSINAQIIIKGRVRLQNSNNKPIEGVQIIFDEASASVISDNNGMFSCYFNNKRQGQIVSCKEVFKKGYVLNNQQIPFPVVLTEDPQYKIDVIMQVEGYLQKEKERLKKNLEKNIENNYRNKINYLENELLNKKITMQTLQKKMEELSENHIKELKIIEEMIEKYSKINLDDNGELYKEAYNYFQNGQMDSALTVLVKADLISNANNHLKERERIDRLEKELTKDKSENEKGIKQIMEPIRLEAQLYCMRYEYEQAGALYSKLLELDSTNVDILFEVAKYWQSRNNYNKALVLFKSSLDCHMENWFRGNVYKEMGTIYQEVGKYDSAMISFNICNKIYTDLYSNKENLFFKSGLALSFQSLGYLYELKGNFNEALENYLQFYQYAKELIKNKSDNDYFKLNFASSCQKIGYIYQLKGEYKQVYTYYMECNNIEEELFNKYSDNEYIKSELAQLYHKIGYYFQKKNDFKKAFEYYNKNFRIEEDLFKSNPRSESNKGNLAISYQSLGYIHELNGDIKKALESYEENNKLSKELYNSNPHSERIKEQLAISYHCLGNIYSQKGEVDKALHSYEEDNRIGKELFKSNPFNETAKLNLAISYGAIGNMYRSKGVPDTALEYYKEYNQLAREMIISNPNSTEINDNIARSFQSIAKVHESKGEYDKILEYYEDFNKLENQLYQANPQREDIIGSLMLSYQGIGYVYQQKGDYNDALNYYKDSYKLGEECINSNPNSWIIISALANSCNALGNIYYSLKEDKKSFGYYEEYNKLEKELYRINPKNEETRLNLAKSSKYLGYLFQVKKEFDKALDLYKESYILENEIYEANPENNYNKNEIATSCLNLGDIYAILKNNNSALEMYLKSANIFEQLLKESSLIKYKLSLSWLYEKLSIYVESNKEKLQYIQKSLDLFLQSATKPYDYNTLLTITFKYGQLSWCLIINKKFEEAENAANNGLSLNSKDAKDLINLTEWINSNLALARLLQNKYSEAEFIYKNYIGKQLVDGRKWNDVFLNDISELEKAGIIHPDYEKIKQLINGKIN